VPLQTFTFLDRDEVEILFGSDLQPVFETVEIDDNDDAYLVASPVEDLEPEPEVYMLVSRSDINKAFHDWYEHNGYRGEDLEDTTRSQSEAFMRWLSVAQFDQTELEVRRASA
jgi:hypothetical protein